MSSVAKMRVSWLSAVFLTILLSACGGGSGGATSGGVTDPAASYKGVTTQAVISPDNAGGLALGGFGGAGVASGMQTLSKSVNGTEGASADDSRLQKIAQALKKSALRMEIPALAKKMAKTVRPSGIAKVLQRVETFQINGDEGGYASYTMDINDANASFSGSVVYHEYAARGIVISGSADILGTLDASRQQLSRLTLSFNSLSMKSASAACTLIGTLSWGFNLSSSSEILSINMVLIDQADAKTYWFRNYRQITVYNDGYLVQNTSGRYYDPDHGYVDFTTQTSLLAYYGCSWPSQGVWQSSGRLGTWVRLSFLPRKLSIEAETDGFSGIDWQTEMTTNNQADSNNAPIAKAGPDLSVSQRATVSLDGSASQDPDGDPLSYSWTFSSCPQNVCPGLSGSNTATPSFIAERSGTYHLSLTVYDGLSVSAADTVGVTSIPAAVSDPDLLQMKWQYGIYGTRIGQSGLLLSDLDGDGTPEIISAASPGGFFTNTYWYVVRQNGDGSYDQIWRSEEYANTIVRLALADLSGDGKDDVVVGLEDGSIRIYDGATLKEMKSFSGATPLTAMAVGDVDGDGLKEIVTSDGIGIFVCASASGVLKWSLDSAGGSSMALGNVDGDSATEIVITANGGKGYVIDGISRATEWEYANGFGAQVALGELDGDGMQEIVGASAWYKITIFDADRKSPAWEIPAELDVDALLVVDTDGDGVPEIVYGDGQWGSIYAIDARTQQMKWSVSNPEHGVSGIAFGDVDRDGKQELLWGAGGTSTGQDHLYVADPASGAIEWQSMHIDGPLSAVAVGDVDDDGEDEIVMVSRESESGYAEGVVHIFNARTQALEYRAKLGVMDWMGVRSVAIGDVDGDGKTEYIITTADIYNGEIRVYDGATHALKIKSAGYDGNYFTALAVGDVDNDGKLEIVAGQGREHTGAQGVYLIVFDGATLQEKWRSVDLGIFWGEVYDIKLADLDGGGNPDIVASVHNNRLVVFDGVNHVQKLAIDLPARALDVADVDNDGVHEILVGREDGKIDIFNGQTFTLERTVTAFSEAPIDALKIVDLAGNGSHDWLVTGGGVMEILDSQGQGLKWIRNGLAANLGVYNRLAIRDTDGNGKKEIFIGSNLFLNQFE